MTNLSNSQIGLAGENAALIYLKNKGCQIVTQNYECPIGEIDIVAKKDNRLIFVEVKTSLETYRNSFSPEERVDTKKRQKLQNLCEMYILRENINPETMWQVDVISVTLSQEGNLLGIEHIENAVWDHRGV